MTRVYTILGPPRTKKNHSEIRRRRPRGHRHLTRCHACGQLNGTPFIAPSTAWEKFCATALVLVDGKLSRYEPVSVPVNCRATFYRDVKSKAQGDAVGFYEGLADVLEKRGVVANDALIRSWDGSRLDVDVENPRTELVLEFLEVS